MGVGLNSLRKKLKDVGTFGWIMIYGEDLDGLCGTVVPWDPLLLGDPMLQKAQNS